MDNAFSFSWLRPLSPPPHIPDSPPQHISDSNPLMHEEDAPPDLVSFQGHQPQPPTTYSASSSHPQFIIDAPPSLLPAAEDSPVNLFNPSTKKRTLMKFFHENQGIYFTKFQLDDQLAIHEHDISRFISEINHTLHEHSLPTIESVPLSKADKTRILLRNTHFSSREVAYSKKYGYRAT